MTQPTTPSYSLIFHGFIDRRYKTAEAFLAAFGSYGSYYSLAYDTAKYVPCELAKDLSPEEAEQKAQLLQDAGMQVDVVLSAEVTEVQHRAEEFWPTHQASNGVAFSTQGNYLIVRGAPLNLRERSWEWRKTHRHANAWRFELAYNHEHPTNTLDRHGLRMARERGAELGAALTECFPERWFLISYRSEQVSFCQFTEELPIGITAGEHRVSDLRVPRDQKEVCFCEVCERANPYVIRLEPDAEFPNAQFADCSVCGNEVILWADDEVVFAPDAARRAIAMPVVPIDAWERNPSEAYFPRSFAELRAAVQDRLHPTPAWWEAAVRLWLARDQKEMRGDEPLLARTLLQIEELTALLLAYRVWQYSLPAEEQDRSPLTPERLGIPPRSLLYHSARRALAPITVLAAIDAVTTHHGLLNGTEEYYLAGRDLGSRVYEARFTYGILDTRGRPLWFHLRGQRQLRHNDTAPHGAEAWSCRYYEIAAPLKEIREYGEERTLAFSVLYDENKRVIAQHRRFIRRFHELDLAPNPEITMTVEDGMLTLRSKVFVWGVFLGWHNNNQLPDNAFDLLPGIPYSIPWDETVEGAPRIRFTGNSLVHPLKSKTTAS